MATSANRTRRRRQRRPIDEARGDKPEALREEQVSELAAAAQIHPASAAIARRATAPTSGHSNRRVPWEAK